MASLRANGIRASGLLVRVSVAVTPVCGRLQRDGLAVSDELDLQFADCALHRAVDPGGQPARQDVERRLSLQARHHRRRDRLERRLIDRRRQQRAPVGDAAPRQVGVAGGVALQPALDRRQRVGAVRGVGDPSNRQLAQRILRGTSGHRSGHHATTGVSGSRNGSTTLLAWSASSPCRRSATTSPAPASPPTRSCASRRGSAALRSPGTTTITRQGCSRLAKLAASIESSSSIVGVKRDHEGEHPAQCDCAALFAEAGDLLVDVVGRRARQVDNHGRLHSRPMRCSISSADAGPQVPDS